MLSSVLNSDRAVQVNIEIMRTFVRLRESVSKHKDLAGKLTELENRYDRQFKVVFDAIRGLMMQPESKRRGIGFTAKFDDQEGTESTSPADSSPWRMRLHPP